MNHTTVLLLTSDGVDMHSEDIERLLAMLNPQCDSKTFAFVRDTLEKTLNKESPSPRTDQQNVDVFDSRLANDPLTW